MPNRMLWIGIPLLALTLAAGAYVVKSGQTCKVKASTDTQLTADVMDSGRKSCCVSQEASTNASANGSTVLTGATSQPIEAQAHVECTLANKASCDMNGSGTTAASPTKNAHATTALQKTSVEKGVCPVTGARVAKKETVKPDDGQVQGVRAGKMTGTTVADVKVASVTK